MHVAAEPPKIDPEVVKRLTMYKNNSMFRQEALQHMAKLLKEDEIEKVKGTFLAIDTDRTSTIKIDELIETLTHMG